MLVPGASRGGLWPSLQPASLHWSPSKTLFGKDWLSPELQVGGGVQGQQQGGFGGAPSQQQPGGWAQPPPYGLQ